MPKHALIIEDELFTALEIRDILETEGFSSFDFASTDKLAYDSAARQRPQIITVDLFLLHGDGKETIDRIHRDFGDIPALFVTGLPEQLTAVPKDRVICKPIARTKFTAAVRALT